MVEWKPALGEKCYGCGDPDHIDYRIWESSDGGFEDTQYKCVTCGLTWWVDGPDA